MEKDIKILEEHLKFIKNFDNNSAYIPALEHLIAGYKELKQQNEENIKALEEKINYLKTLNFGTDLVTQSTANLTTICILEELLQEGDK